MKIEGSGSASGSISKRHGSADTDQHQNVMDPQHCLLLTIPPPFRSCLRPRRSRTPLGASWRPWRRRSSWAERTCWRRRRSRRGCWRPAPGSWMRPSKRSRSSGAHSVASQHFRIEVLASVADPGCLSRIRIIHPGSEFFPSRIPDSGSASRSLSNFNPKNGF
jgi:hypothetical protein